MVKGKWIEEDLYLIYRKDFSILMDRKLKLFHSSPKFDTWKNEDLVDFVDHQLKLISRRSSLVDKKERAGMNKRAACCLISFPLIFLLILKMFGLI